MPFYGLSSLSSGLAHPSECNDCHTLVDAVPPLLLAKSLGVEDDAVVPADADGSTVAPW